jgi:hypothetical protein
MLFKTLGSAIKNRVSKSNLNIGGSETDGSRGTAHSKIMSTAQTRDENLNEIH